MKASNLPALCALIICASLTACSETPSETEVASGSFTDEAAAGSADYQVTKADHDNSGAMELSSANATNPPDGAEGARMPSGFTLYPGAKMGEGLSSVGQDGGGGMATFEVAAKSKDVVEFYRKQVQANGMRVTKDGKSGIVHMLNGANGNSDTKTISFQISPNGSGTKAQIIYSGK